MVFLYSTHYSCQILIKLDFNRQIFKNHSNIKFHENPSSGSQDVRSERIDEQTDMTELIIVLRNFSKAPINRKHFFPIRYSSFLLITLSKALVPEGKGGVKQLTKLSRNNQHYALICTIHFFYTLEWYKSVHSVGYF
jgi:hypothetical protein